MYLRRESNILLKYRLTTKIKSEVQITNRNKLKWGRHVLRRGVKKTSSLSVQEDYGSSFLSCSDDRPIVSATLLTHVSATRRCRAYVNCVPSFDSFSWYKAIRVSTDLYRIVGATTALHSARHTARHSIYLVFLLPTKLKWTRYNQGYIIGVTVLYPKLAEKLPNWQRNSWTRSKWWCGLLIVLYEHDM